MTFKEAYDVLIKNGCSRYNARRVLMTCTYGMSAARLEKFIQEKIWLSRIEALRPGDACEHYQQVGFDEQGYSVRAWKLCTVVHNGGSGYWRLLDEEDGRTFDDYIEHIRLPGQTEAWGR